MTDRWSFCGLALVALAISVAGCGPQTEKAGVKTHSAKAELEVRTERAKLSAEDLALVESQEWCVVSSDERLGSMGPPLKLFIKDKPVFVCCENCGKKAESDSEKTLIKLDELRAKAKLEKETKK